MIDYGMFPPEINSGRLYAGPGAAPMLTAANAWDELAAELSTAATGYGSASAHRRRKLRRGPDVRVPSRSFLSSLSLSFHPRFAQCLGGSMGLAVSHSTILAYCFST